MLRALRDLSRCLRCAGGESVRPEEPCSLGRMSEKKTRRLSGKIRKERGEEDHAFGDDSF